MYKPSVTTYTPHSSVSNPLAMLVQMFRDLARSRDLGWRLAVRDIQAQYRQAYLGVIWAFIAPLSTTITWLFLNGTGIISVGETELPYPVYIITGTILWSIMIDAMNAPLQQTNAARDMLAKLNFPREGILLSGLYQVLFNSGIKLIILICALLVLGITPGWGLLLFPLGILSLVLVGTVIGLLITPIGMLYTDIGRAVPLFMNFVMYLTPVVFPMPKEGWVATLFQINPMTPIILTARDWLTGFPPDYLMYFLGVNAVALFLLILAWSAYRLAMPILIERMSS
ncbi:MAG: ABC transporter permease [Pseudomonadota bacterium]|nr:ABC transporter permease [Pseudomonadota bacterium]